VISLGYYTGTETVLQEAIEYGLLKTNISGGIK